MFEVSPEQSRSICIQSAVDVAAAALCVAIMQLLQQRSAASCCCSSSYAGWPNLLLVHWIWSQCFLSLHSNAVYFWCIPWQLAVPCHTYGLDLPTSSVISGMRGAKTGVSPPRWSPLCILYVFFHRDAFCSLFCDYGLDFRKWALNINNVTTSLLAGGMTYVWYMVYQYRWYASICLVMSVGLSLSAVTDASDVVSQLKERMYRKFEMWYHVPRCQVQTQVCIQYNVVLLCLVPLRTLRLQWCRAAVLDSCSSYCCTSTTKFPKN